MTQKNIKTDVRIFAFFLHFFTLSFQELEQIEEHYKQETRDLLSTVKRLQDENRKLSSSLAAATERDSAFSEDGSSGFCKNKKRQKSL